MITIYTGRPGSGKSYHATEVIHNALLHGKFVISNFEVYMPDALMRDFFYVPTLEWMQNAYKGEKRKFSYLQGLYGFAYQFHETDASGRFIEGQTLLVLDECHLLFNSRTWNRPDRLAWCEFFREHRKLGFDVLLITQNDAVLDKQIVPIIEFKYEHKNVKNYKVFGRALARLAGGSLFTCAISMYAIKSKRDAHIRTEWIRGKTAVFAMYNTSKVFRPDVREAS